MSARNHGSTSGFRFGSADTDTVLCAGLRPPRLGDLDLILKLIGEIVVLKDCLMMALISLAVLAAISSLVKIKVMSALVGSFRFRKFHTGCCK
jgi:hypothetical protein